MVCVVVSMAGGLSVAWLGAMAFYAAAAAVLLTAPETTSGADLRTAAVMER